MVVIILHKIQSYIIIKWSMKCMRMLSNFSRNLTNEIIVIIIKNQAWWPFFVSKNLSSIIKTNFETST